MKQTRVKNESSGVPTEQSMCDVCNQVLVVSLKNTLPAGLVLERCKCMWQQRCIVHRGTHVLQISDFLVPLTSQRTCSAGLRTAISITSTSFHRCQKSLSTVWLQTTDWRYSYSLCFWIQLQIFNQNAFGRQSPVAKKPCPQHHNSDQLQLLVRVSVGLGTDCPHWRTRKQRTSAADLARLTILYLTAVPSLQQRSERDTGSHHHEITGAWLQVANGKLHISASTDRVCSTLQSFFICFGKNIQHGEGE